MTESAPRKNRLSTRRGCLRWLLVIFVAAMALPAVFLLVGFIYETVASKSDLQRNPPPGKLIDVGGYKLHLYCTGERRADLPTVVLEAGSGSASPNWGLVQPEVAEITRVCSYDRAGYAWSEPGPLPRTSQRFAAELHTLLTNAGEEGPFVLVGSSFGAHTVRLYAQGYPQEVAGMVLVDARSENLSLEPAMSDSALSFWGFMARCGFFRMIGKNLAFMYPWMEKLPGYPVTIMFRPQFFETNRDEDAVESDKQVQASGGFGDLPLIVIVHGIPSMFDHLPPEEASQSEEAYQAAQRELAGLSTNGQLIVAEGSGHAISLERPDVVIEAIRQVLQPAP